MILKTSPQIIIFCFLLIFQISTVKAQTINTDRPDQSDGVSTIGKFNFQLEEGITISEKSVFNELMLRFGLTNSTDIRLQINAGENDFLEGIQPLSLSIKQNILQQKGIIPAITIIGAVDFGPVASRDFRTNQYPYAFKLAFENVINNWFTISYNIGTANEFEMLNTTFNLGFSPCDNTSLFMEYFGSFAKEYHDNNIDAGILYVITPQLQVDLAAGTSIDELGENWYSTFGISYLFDQNEEH